MVSVNELVSDLDAIDPLDLDFCLVRTRGAQLKQLAEQAALDGRDARDNISRDFRGGRGLKTVIRH